MLIKQLKISPSPFSESNPVQPNTNWHFKNQAQIFQEKRDETASYEITNEDVSVEMDAKSTHSIIPKGETATHPTVGQTTNILSPEEVEQSKIDSKNLVSGQESMLNSFEFLGEVDPTQKASPQNPIAPNLSESQKIAKAPDPSGNSVLYKLHSMGQLSFIFSDDEEKQKKRPDELLRKERYSIEQEIAKGGMGQVELVKDNDLKRTVALKSMLPAQASRQNALERFVEEAQMTGQLEHPNIVPIYDIGIDSKNRVYFTMKFIEGWTLEKVIQKLKFSDREAQEKYSQTYLLQLFIQICNAIAFAHSRNVIHRDLKPANIMLGPFGEMIVMDWGLAKGARKKRSLPTRRKRRKKVLK